MTTKRFINTDGMKDEILELLKAEYLSKEFYGEKIEVKLDLKEMVEKKMEEQHVSEPKIYITVSAYHKIQTLVKEFSSEVAWHCLVEHPEGTNAYLIYDVLVFPQEVTGTTANGIDGEYEMWLATLPDEQFNKCRCHMHSHVNMGVTPSGIDEGYYANLMTQVTDFYITMIINKRDDYHLRFYDKTNNVLYIDKELIICFEDGTPIKTWYDTVKTNVKERTVIPVRSSALEDWEKNRTQSSMFEDDYYGSYYKKKETKTSQVTGKGRGRPKKNDIKKDDLVRIQGPDNVIYSFVSIDCAVNYIYNQYPDVNHAFSKNNMRHHLAKDGAIAYDDKIKDFVYDFYDKEGGLEYAILKCDLWEVMKGESK